MKLEGKTRLISFGCSFTSGAELIDHELLGISFDDCNKIKQKWLSDKKTMHHFEAYVSSIARITPKEYAEMCSKRSYASKLADKLGLEHVNYAIPGASVDHMVLDLFREHYTQKINAKTDLVFLGITLPHRYLSFSPAGTGVPHSRVMSHRDFFDADVHYNDYKVMQTFFCALQNFKNFCIANNFDFYMQPMTIKELLFYNPTNPKANMFADIYYDWQYLPTFERILQEILEYAVDPNLSLHFPMNFTPCGFDHPPESVHERFSKELYDKIIAGQN